MIKKMLLGALLVAHNLMGQAMSPEAMATMVRGMVRSDVLAKRNTFDVVAMWCEATSFMTHDEKVIYTKEFLASLEKQEAAVQVEQELEQERLAQQAKQLDIEQAHAIQQRAQQDFNQKIKIGVGIAAAVLVVAVIYYLLKNPSNSTQPAATARAPRTVDPFPQAHCSPPAYVPSTSYYPPEQPHWTPPAPSHTQPSYSFGYAHPAGFAAHASSGLAGGLCGSYASPSVSLYGAMASGGLFKEK
jgi:hypothetical protein